MSLFADWPSIEEMESIYLRLIDKGISVLHNTNYYSLGYLYWDRGCARRLRVLLRCLSNVFSILPYNKEHLFSNLDSGLIEDVNICFNSFIITSHGYLDDLAFLIEEFLPSKAKHSDPRYVSLNNIKWKEFEGSFQELEKTIVDYLKETETNEASKLIRNRCAHRLCPYLLPTIKSEEKYREDHNTAIQLLMGHDFEGYNYYSKLAEQQIQYLGLVMSDSLEPGEQSIVVHSIHCSMMDTLNDILNLTIEVLRILTGVEYKSCYSREPFLINYNWREK